MSRAHLRQTIQNIHGEAIIGALCNIYQHGTTSFISDMFSAESGGISISTLTSNIHGTIEGWFDSKQIVDIQVTDNGGTASLESGEPVPFSSYTVTVEVEPPPPETGEIDTPQTWSGDNTFSGAVTFGADPTYNGTKGEPVHKSQVETVTGTKTFTSGPVFSSDPTFNGTYGPPVHLSQNETITGNKTFQGNAYFKSGSPWVDVKAFGAVGDGVTDDTTAFLNTMAALSVTGGVFFIPAGHYIVKQTIGWDAAALPSPVPAYTAPGIIVRGVGRYASVVDFQPVAGGSLFEFVPIDPVVEKGLILEQFGIVSTAGAGSRHGIYIKGVWQSTLNHVRVEGLSGNGVWIDSPLGDSDAPANITLDSCYLWSNGGYGLKASCGAGTANISYLAIRSSNIQANVSGGVYWTGALCSIRDTGFAANRGAGGLLVDYTGSTSQGLTLDTVTFENNYPRHLDVVGLSVLEGTNIDFRHSDHASFPATEGVRFKPAVGVAVTGVEFRGGFIRVDSAFNPYTMFVLDGSAGSGATVQGFDLVKPTWSIFGSAGQTHWSIAGAVYDFNPITPHRKSPSSLTLGAGNNNNVSIGNIYEEFTLNGAATACTITGLGGTGDLLYEGRRILFKFIHNGGNLTLSSDDTNSTAASRLVLPGGISPVTTKSRVPLLFEWTTIFGGGGWMLLSEHAP